MNATPIIVGFKSSDKAVVCDSPLKAADYIADLIEGGEEPANIVAYLAQMVNVNIEVKRTANVTIG